MRGHMYSRYLAKENITEVISLCTSVTYLVWVTFWDTRGWEEFIAGVAE